MDRLHPLVVAAASPPCLARACFGGLLLLGALLFSGCGDAGTGQVAGTLFLRGCPDQDPTNGQGGVPAMLPAFSLDPQFFAAEVMLSVRMGSTYDPRGVDSLRLRLQRSSHPFYLTDDFELLVYDLDQYPQRQAAAIAQGQPGMPILPPALAQPSVPLPGDPAASVRASLSLHATCPYMPEEPLLRGYVNFSALGRNLGDTVAGQFAVTVEDARSRRAQGMMPATVDVAGQLSGSFSVQIQAGPAQTSL
jgi:hypothetical protein